MEIIETAVFSYDGLTEEAKEKARDWYRRGNQEDSWGYECVFEDVADIAELFGLDIRQTRKQSSDSKKHWYDPTIYFSGFWSQGDGACFEGTYSYKKGALKAVIGHAPTDKELHRIVAELQELQRRNFYRVRCTTKHRGHYNHSGCMWVECENVHDNYLPVIDEDAFVQCMRDFADWIYKQLEREFDFINSDEAIEESIRANEYQFDECGNVF